VLGGLGQDVSEMGMLTGPLARQFQVIAIDNRGSGPSAKPPGPYTVEQMAADAAGVMDHLGLSRAHLAGISLGGRIAMALALDRGERVDRLVLVSTGPRAAGGRWLVRAGMMIADLPGLRGGYRQPRHAMKAQFDATTRFDRTNQLPHIKAPTVIVHGTSDRIAPLAMAEQMRTLIPNSRLVLIDGGHLAPLLAEHQRLVSEIRAFLTASPLPVRRARNQRLPGHPAGDRWCMPAQPGRQPEQGSSANEPHRQRQVAESFGADSGRYDRARPGYPGALVDRIVAASPGPGVLDVGCGTGIAARQFQAAGCRVLGVDPDARMAYVARQRGVEVEVAAFEAWDPAGRAFDAVIAAQAWHWVDPLAGAAKAARALRPGGRLAVFWNAFQPPPDLGEAFAAVHRQVMSDAPNFWAMPVLDAYLTMCGQAAGGIRRAGAFGDQEQWRFGWDRHYTRDEWLDQVPTMGPHTQLSPAALDNLLTGFGAAIDAAGGSFTMQYTTVAVTVARNGSPDPA
jgi:SAM-dependent methyltransferase/surfactin synthase thioesterase subunit